MIAALTDSLEETFRCTVLQTIITHYNPLAVLCGALHNWMIVNLLAGVWPFEGTDGDGRDWLVMFEKDWGDWLVSCDDEHVKTWEKRVGKKSMFAAWTTLAKTKWSPEEFNPFTATYAGRAGYCVLTLEVAVWCLVQSILKGPVSHRFNAVRFTRIWNAPINRLK